MLLFSVLACQSPAPEVPPAQPASAEPAAEPTPPSDALRLMESCMHWAGEESEDPARAKEIADNTNSQCPRALAAARAQYDTVSKDPASAAVLVDLLTHLGEPGPGPMEALCVTAAEHHAAEKAKGETLYEPYFAMACGAQARVVCGESLCN